MHVPHKLLSDSHLLTTYQLSYVSLAQTHFSDISSQKEHPVIPLQDVMRSRQFQFHHNYIRMCLSPVKVINYVLHLQLAQIMWIPVVYQQGNIFCSWVISEDGLLNKGMIVQVYKIGSVL